MDKTGNRWCKNPIYCGISYHPPTSSNTIAKETIQELESPLSRIQNSHANVWLCGDFNLPDIDWDTLSVGKGCRQPDLRKYFIDILMDANLEQQNTLPTRNSNILDRFITNTPMQTQQIKVIPGLSDHDTLLVDSLIKPLKPNTAKKQVFLYSRADFDGFRRDLDDFKSQFLAEAQHKAVDMLWQEYLETMLKLKDKHIPSKSFSSRQKYPWINVPIWGLLRKKERAFNQAKKTGKPTDWHRFCTLK